jgi:hypothetical protein
MAVKIAAIVMTLLLTLGAGFVVFVFMVVAMNGFSEREATWGIGAFAVMAVIIVAAVSAFSGLLATRFTSRSMHGALAAFLAILICSVVGASLVGASGFGGVIVADIVRRNR